MTRKNPFLPSAQQSGEKSRLTSEEPQKIYLGEEARSEARDKLTADKKQATAQKKKKDLHPGCVALIAIVVFGGYLWLKLSPPGEWETEYAALLHCEGHVRTVLDSPSSADFPFSRIGSAIRRLENNTYRITSHFDSKNVYGTTMRTEYVCTIRFEGDPEDLTDEALRLRQNWTLIDMRFGRPVPQ